MQTQTYQNIFVIFWEKKSIFDSFNKYYVPLQVAVFTTEGKTEIFLYLAVVYLGFQSFLSVVAFLRFLRLICLQRQREQLQEALH